MASKHVPPAGRSHRPAGASASVAGRRWRGPAPLAAPPWRPTTDSADTAGSRWTTPPPERPRLALTAGAAERPPPWARPSTVSASRSRSSSPTWPGRWSWPRASIPRTWAGIMDRLFAIAAEGVRRFGGTVDKFTGDGIMALFGAPAAQEDHARRACHAALHLSSVVGAYAVELRRSHGAQPRSCGSGSTPARWSPGGSGGAGSSDYTAVGHTVGLAQRMEALAEPGTVYVTEHTARLVAGQFRLARPRARPWSRESPSRLACLRPRGRRSPPAGLARWADGRRLVGRADELAVLEGGPGPAPGREGPGGRRRRRGRAWARAGSARSSPGRPPTGASPSGGRRVCPTPPACRSSPSSSSSATTSASPRPTPRPGRREKVAGRLLAARPRLRGGPSAPLRLPRGARPGAPAPAAGRRGPHPPGLRRAPAAHPAPQRARDARAPAGGPPLVRPAERRLPGRADRPLPRHPHPGGGELPPRFDAAWMRHSYYHRLPLNPLSRRCRRASSSGRLLGPRSLPRLRWPPGSPSGPGGTRSSSRRSSGRWSRTGRWPVRPAPTCSPARPTERRCRHRAGHAGRPHRPARRRATRQLLQTAAVIGRTFSEASWPPWRGAAGRRPGRRAAPPVRSRVPPGGNGLAGRRSSASGTRSPPRWPTRPCSSDPAPRLHAAVAAALADLDPARLDERAALIASHYARAERSPRSGPVGGPGGARGSSATTMPTPPGAGRWCSRSSTRSTIPKSPSSRASGPAACSSGPFPGWEVSQSRWTPCSATPGLGPNSSATRNLFSSSPWRDWWNPSVATNSMRPVRGRWRFAASAGWSLSRRPGHRPDPAGVRRTVGRTSL